MNQRQRFRKRQMSALHKQVFLAIEALPRPVTPEQALETGNAMIPLGPQTQQWENWMKTNGAQLCQLLNKGHE